MSAKRRRKGRNAGAIGIVLMVVVFLSVMTLQILRLNAKVENLSKQKEALQKQYEEETERTLTLDAYEAFVNSSDYIEEMAKSKLGLVYDNEVIYREKEKGSK